MSRLHLCRRSAIIDPETHCGSLAFCLPSAPFLCYNSVIMEPPSGSQKEGTQPVMTQKPDTRHWETLSYEEKNRRLFENQKETLDLFLARRAITQAQYDKSLGDLIAKMKITM